MTAWIEVASRQNVFGPQNVLQLIPADMSELLVELEDQILVVAFLLSVVPNHMNAGDSPELILVALVVVLVHLDKTVEAFQRGQAHRRRALSHLSVGAERYDAVVSGKSKIRHEPDLRRQRIIVRDDRAALGGTEELGGMKAKDLCSAEIPDHTALVRGSERVRGIEHQREAVRVSDLGQGADIATTAPQMNANDPARARRNQRLDPLRVEVVSGWIDIAEDRRDAVPQQRVRRRDKGE